MKIDGRLIGPEHHPYLIAEISGEHLGSAKRGCLMIDEAQKAGADAIKLQCYSATTLTFRGEGDEFKIMEGPWAGQTLHELYTQTETPRNLLSKLIKHAQSAGITAFSSVFSLEDVDFLADLGVPAFKIASFELTDLPLIQAVGKTGLPAIISTGMGSTEEITDSINSYNTLSGKPDQLGVLHCISSYPAPPSAANLPALGPLSELLGGRHVVGLSDHSLGVGVSAAAVAFGASIIEKHFTLNRTMGGPDAAFSLEPAEFRLLVNTCREAWQAIQPHQAPVRENVQFRKSLYVVKDVACGEAFSCENVRSIRPAAGLPPKFYQSVLAGVATQDLRAGTPISRQMVSTLC